MGSRPQSPPSAAPPRQIPLAAPDESWRLDPRCRKIGWSDEIDSDFHPESFEKTVSSVLANLDDSEFTVEYDCDDFPCLAIVHGPTEPSNAASVRENLITSFGGEDQVGIKSMRHSSVGAEGSAHVAVYSVFPSSYDGDEQFQERLDSRFSGWRRDTAKSVSP